MCLILFAGQSQTPNRQHINARSVSINVISAGGLQNNHESDQQIPSSIIQFLRNLYPGEVHVEDGNVEETAVGSDSNQARTSIDVETAQADLRVSEEGIFLSNMLRQIMPIISQQAGPDQAIIRNHTRAQESSSQVGLLSLY